MSFVNKAAFVMEGASGIGKSLVKQFAASGGRVARPRDVERAPATAEEISRADGIIITNGLDRE